MLSAALLFVCVVIGYVLSAGLVGLTTYGLSVMIPGLAVRENRIRTPFNLLLSVVWLLAAALGGYVAARGAIEASPQRAVELLTLVLLITLWINPATTRQRGLFHMLLNSGLLLLGAATGYTLALRGLPQ